VGAVLMLSGALVLFYVSVGYPAAMAVWARVAPRPVKRDDAHRPLISIIVAAFNERDVIHDKVANLKALDYPEDRLEIIVVSDGSDDDTAARAEAPGVTVLHRDERNGKQAAVLRGADHARGDILVVTDANNALSPNSMREIAAMFADPAVGVVSGRKAIPTDGGRGLDALEGGYWKYESKLKAWETATGSTPSAVGELSAFRREAFIDPGEGMITEDFVQAMLAAGAGWRVAYTPDAVSTEMASASTSDEAKRRRRITNGRLQAFAHVFPRVASRDKRLAWQMISHKGLRPLIPLATASVGVGAALTAWHSRLRVLAILGAAVLTIAAVGGWLSEKRERRVLPLYAVFYAVKVHIATIMGVVDFFRGRRSNLWERVERAPVAPESELTTPSGR